jgi:uncharacterized protein HemY
MRIALALITLLAFMLFAAGMKDVDPGMVVLNWREWELEAPGSVVAIALLLLMTVAYFFGELVGWLRRLPSRLAAFVSGRNQHSTLALLAEAQAASMLGETKKANKALAKAKPSEQEAAVHTLLRISHHMSAGELVKYQGNAVFGAPASLALARLALAENDWRGVKDHTAAGLTLAPESPRLLALHLKALVNLGESSAAEALLPELQRTVSKPTLPLLASVLKPAGTPVQPNHLWYKAFTQWLGTSSEIIPEAHLYGAKKAPAETA